jgi:uncharacterized protein YcbX
MIVDDRGQFVTQRVYPRLARVGLAMEKGEVFAEIAGRTVQLERRKGPGDRTVRVWNSELLACDLGDDVAESFSNFLGQPVRVVYMSDENRRFSNPERVPDQLVSFADGYPYLITNVGSLDDLNARASTSLGMERFRANVVVSGAPPWDEDNWATIEMGDLVLTLVKPCARCSMTTVDPVSGEFVGPEPLRTLSGFRRRDDGVMFGWNAVGPDTGTIRLGDEVVVSYR